MRHIFLVAALIAATAATLAGQKPAPKQPEMAEQLAKRYESSHYRVSGALLTIKARAGKDDGRTQEVVIDWAIDYNGPRPPLTVFKPSLDVFTNGETRLYVYYPGEKGEGVETHTQSPIAHVPLTSTEAKDNFVTAEKGQPATGSMTVKFGEVGPLELNGRHPMRRFEKGTTVYLRLRHNPTQRGGDLDAWTGHLSSNIATVNFD